MRIMRKNYVHIDFPPLTEAQRQEINDLMLMRDEDINTDDIPVCDFSDAVPYYVQDTVGAGDDQDETDSTTESVSYTVCEPCLA